MRFMPIKDRVIQLIASLPDTPETERWLKSIARDLSSNGTGNGIKAKKVGRLSFSAIGEADPVDGAKRFDELLGSAINRRHTIS